MLKDTLEILEFTFELIKNKQVKQNHCIETYDLYRHLDLMRERMDLLIKFVQRDWRDYNEDTQHGSRMKKWVVFVNQELHEYVDSKYMMFCKVMKLENAPFSYEGVLTKNFLHKTLNCKVNKYLNYPRLDDEMKLTHYHFNLTKLPQRNYEYSDAGIDRNKLWSKQIIDLQEDKVREAFIKEMEKDLERLNLLSLEFEKLLVHRYSMKDMFIKDEAFPDFILYLDDIRHPKYVNEYIIVRSYDEAVAFVEEYGIPKIISFDHDLGMDKDENILPSGYDFAKWLVEMDMEGKYKIPKEFRFNVHSANPVGKKSIESYLNNYLKFKEEE